MCCHIFKTWRNIQNKNLIKLLIFIPTCSSMDVLKPGQIGGNCLLHKARLEENLIYMAPLQSWAPELRNFVALNNTESLSDVSSRQCDVNIDKPTFVMKIDAAVNYYHHFCDFFNLYASLHINSTHPDMFSRDVHILIWENRAYQVCEAEAKIICSYL